jgi:hypothetical protein
MHCDCEWSGARSKISLLGVPVEVWQSEKGKGRESEPMMWRKQ